MAENNYQMLIEMRDSIIAYLDEEKGINEDALKAYEPAIIQDSDSEMRLIREREAIKLRDRVLELKRHIAVIKRMFPST